MERKPQQQQKKPGGSESRDDRLKAALKANIARRKAQARLRRDEQDRAEDDRNA